MSDQHRSEAERSEQGEIEEPPNSTVDDWLGQQVNQDEELIQQLLEETGGDLDEAERRFRQRTNRDRSDRLPTERRRT